MRASIVLALVVGYAMADSTQTDPSQVNANLQLNPLPSMAYSTALIADLSLPWSVGEQLAAGGVA